MKYVLFAKTIDGDLYRVEPVLFHDTVVHKQVADAMSQLLGAPFSAGFVGTDGKVFGKSTSLGVGSAKDDQLIIDYPQMYKVMTANQISASRMGVLDKATVVAMPQAESEKPKIKGWTI